MNTAGIILLIGQTALHYGIPPRLAVAVATVESNLNPSAIGGQDEQGLFQLKPSTYPKINKKALLNPKTNIELGVRYLAWVRDNCKHKQDNTFLVCFNYGIKNAEHVRYPKQFPYYKKVMKAMKEFKKGQKVAVENLRNNNATGFAVYISEHVTDKNYKGYHKIHTEDDLVVFVAMDRIKDEEEYFAEIRKRYV